MATITVNGSALGESLLGLLLADDIEPGSQLSYATAKIVYAFHPLGAKLAELPIRLAQSKPGLISIPNSPEDRVKKQFTDQWRRDGADKHLFSHHRLKRIYGISAIALLTENKTTDTEVDYDTLWKDNIAFNVLDPLNTAGSLTGHLDPNSMGFLKTWGSSVNGQKYHRSRSC